MNSTSGHLHITIPQFFFGLLGLPILLVPPQAFAVEHRLVEHRLVEHRLVEHRFIVQGDQSHADGSAQNEQDAVFITDATGKIFFTVHEASGAAELSLVKHLQDINAVMYGVFWCPHCYEQKRLFGVEALSLLNFVECDSQGLSPQAELCKQQFAAAKAQTGEPGVFPTWEINGKFYYGTHDLKELAEYSGYRGPTNFLRSLGD